MLTTSQQADLNRLSRLVADTGYAFITPTPATIARNNARDRAKEAHDLQGVFGWSRPFRAGVLPRPIQNAAERAGVLREAGGLWRSTIRLSTLDGSLFMHSAYPTDAADSVFFGPDTYRFARAIRANAPASARRIVDIGCGAGPGAVVAARSFPGAEVIGVDINKRALLLTRVNAEVAGVTIEARRSDLLDGVDGQFDLIVANPPYLVDPGERAYRHGGGPLGAGLSLKILDAAIGRLAPGGTLLLYTGAAIVDGVDPFRTEALARLRETDLRWTYDEVDPDVFGEELDTGAYATSDRIAAVVLVAQKRK